MALLTARDTWKHVTNLGLYTHLLHREVSLNQTKAELQTHHWENGEIPVLHQPPSRTSVIASLQQHFVTAHRRELSQKTATAGSSVSKVEPSAKGDHSTDTTLLQILS